MTYIVKENRKKWDSKTKKCIFVGYSSTSKGYSLQCLISMNQVFLLRNCLDILNEFEVDPGNSKLNENVQHATCFHCYRSLLT